jgi:hypothetical protein
MYPQYNCLNVSTWIIGPALGEGLLIDRPADVLKVWPTREPIQRLPPAQFSPLLDQLAEEKTRNGILCTPSVNPPRKQRMSFRQRSVTYVKSFLRAFTREKRYPTCFKFRYSEFQNILSSRFVPLPGADEIKSAELLNSQYSVNGILSVWCSDPKYVLNPDDIR